MTGSQQPTFADFYKRTLGGADAALPPVDFGAGESRSSSPYTTTQTATANVAGHFGAAAKALQESGASSPAEVLKTYRDLLAGIGPAPTFGAVPGPMDVSAMRQRAQGTMEQHLSKFVAPRILEAMGSRGMRYSTATGGAIADAAARQQLDMEKLFAPLEASAYEGYAGREMQQRQLQVQLYAEQQEFAQAALNLWTQAEIANKNNQFALATEYAKQAVAAEEAAQARMVQLTQVNAQLEAVDRNNRTQLSVTDRNNRARLQESLLQTGERLYSKYNPNPQEYSQMVQGLLGTYPIYPQIVQSSPVYRKEQTPFDTINEFNKMLAGGASLGASLIGTPGQTGAIGLLAEAGKAGVKTVGELYNWIMGGGGGINDIPFSPGAAGESYADIFPGVDPSTPLDYDMLASIASDYGSVPIDMLGGSF